VDSEHGTPQESARKHNVIKSFFAVSFSSAFCFGNMKASGL